MTAARDGSHSAARDGLAGARGDSRGGTRAVLVLVCGDAARGDDRAGLLAAELIRGWLDGLATPPRALEPALAALTGHVDVRDVGQLEPDDVLSASSDEAVVVVDAARGLPAGQVARRPLAGLGSGGPVPRSSHMLPLRDVLALAETLRGSLPKGTFVGLGGSAFGLGDPPSDAVLGGVPAFAAAVVEEAARLLSA